MTRNIDKSQWFGATNFAFRLIWGKSKRIFPGPPRPRYAKTQLIFQHILYIYTVYILYIYIHILTYHYNMGSWWKLLSGPEHDIVLPMCRWVSLLQVSPGNAGPWLNEGTRRQGGIWVTGLGWEWCADFKHDWNGVLIIVFINEATLHIVTIWCFNGN
jgi:hypothetical protein